MELTRRKQEKSDSLRKKDLSEEPYKTIVFIRHGESTFNKWRKNSFKRCSCFCNQLKYFREDLRDAPLSDKGVKQVRNLAKRIKELGIKEKAQLIVVSPFARALQTALGGFGLSENWETNKLQNISACSANSVRPQSTEVLNSSVEGSRTVENEKFRPLVLGVLREKIGSSCDIGTPKGKLEKEFGDAVDFMPDMPESWWYPSYSDKAINNPKDGIVIMESDKYFKRRVSIFREWLLRRPEVYIVVVGHSNFFRTLFGSSLKMSNCGIKKQKIINDVNLALNYKTVWCEKVHPVALTDSTFDPVHCLDASNWNQEDVEKVSGTYGENGPAPERCIRIANHRFSSMSSMSSK